MNSKNNVKLFLKPFITSSILIIIVLVIYLLVIIKGQNNKKVFNSRDMEEQISIILDFDSKTSKWNKMFNEGNYYQMYKAVSDSLYSDYDSRIGMWKHYAFYRCYANYATLSDSLEAVNNKKRIGKGDYANILYNILNLYAKAIIKPNLEISYKEQMLMEDFFLKGKKEALKILELSEDDFNELAEKLVGDKGTYINVTECEAIAEERLGDNFEVR